MRSWWCFWGWGGGYHPQIHPLGLPSPPSLPHPDLDPHRQLQRPAGTQIIGFSIPIPPSQRAQLAPPPFPTLFLQRGACPASQSDEHFNLLLPTLGCGFCLEPGRVLAETCAAPGGVSSWVPFPNS